ncbi:hypothetical protein BGZ82_009364 [Podila clonocystis]|nr:hypothetical protein BGZ82_009364 [Podila clonocystis]
MVYCSYGDCYGNGLENVLIAGVVVVGVAVIAGVVWCIHSSKVKRRKAATSASSSAENGLPMTAVQGTSMGLDGQPYQQQIQVQGPFFMTSQRGPNGEELVMVPRRLLAQFQEQQQREQLLQQLQQLQNQQQRLQQQYQQAQQGQYELPPVVPPTSTHLPQALQRGDKAQIEDQQSREQHQQPQPNLNAHLQPIEPVMSQRKFEKSVKVEHEGVGGAGVGTGSDVVVVHEEPLSSGSENRSNENDGAKTST